MTWRVLYLPEAQKDLKGLAGNQRSLVIKAIEKVRKNPLPDSEGGYGKPLGNHNGKNLSGFLKIKLRDAGLRVIYQIQRTETEMLIIVIGARADEDVYADAAKRVEKHQL